MGYHLPGSVDEALGVMAARPVRIIAGGTDVYPGLSDQPLAGDIVDVTSIKALNGITRHDGTFRFGALATWSDVVRADLPGQFDGLKAAAREVGSIQIQNVATLVGNLCNASPAADGVPALMALDATVEIASGAGYHHVKLEDFITGNRQTVLRPGELVTAVEVPVLPDASRSAFVKLGSRRYLVISIAMVAAVLVPGADARIAAARVAVGACSPVAVRLKGLEEALTGRAWAEAAKIPQKQHLAALSAIDDIRATAAYRLEAALELVRRALDACVTEDAP